MPDFAPQRSVEHDLEELRSIPGSRRSWTLPYRVMGPEDHQYLELDLLREAVRQNLCGNALVPRYVVIPAYCENLLDLSGLLKVRPTYCADLVLLSHDGGAPWLGHPMDGVRATPEPDGSFRVPISDWVRHPSFSRMDGSSVAVYQVLPVPGNPNEILVFRARQFLGGKHVNGALLPADIDVSLSLHSLEDLQGEMSSMNPNDGPGLLVSVQEIEAGIPSGSFLSWTSQVGLLKMFRAPSRATEEIRVSDLRVAVDPSLHGVRCLLVPGEFFAHQDDAL